MKMKFQSNNVNSLVFGWQLDLSSASLTRFLTNENRFIYMKI